MNPGYMIMGTVIAILLIIIAFLFYKKPSTQPVVVVDEKETPTWIPWSWGWAQNPGTLSIHRPVPYFYPMMHHAGSHPAITQGHHRPPLAMPQTPVPPHSQQLYYKQPQHPHPQRPQQQHMN